MSIRLAIYPFSHLSGYTARPLDGFPSGSLEAYTACHPEASKATLWGKLAGLAGAILPAQNQTIFETLGYILYKA